MKRRRPPTIVFARVFAIALMVPGLLQVPLPHVDFHVIRHHHGAGEVCPKHDHLLRWHPQAGEGEDVAVFHWHWLLPRASDSDDSDRSIPALHAHDGDQDGQTPSSSPVVVREATGTESRCLFGPSPGLNPEFVGWVALVHPPRSTFAPSSHGTSDVSASDAVLARLVRWNC